MPDVTISYQADGDKKIRIHKGAVRIVERARKIIEAVNEASDELDSDAVSHAMVCFRKLEEMAKWQ